MALLPRSKESSISNTSSNDNSSGNGNNNKLATTRWYSRKGLTVVGICLALAMSISQMEREGKGITQVVASLREYPVPVTGITNRSNWTKQEELQVQQQQETTKSSTASSRFPPGFLPNQTLYNLHHHANQEILELLDWEETSRIGILNDTANSCQPPPGTPRTCCLGCFSRGGGMDPNVRHQCAHAFHGKDNNNQWEMLQEQVHKFFADNKPHDNAGGGLPCDICQIVELSRLHSLRIAMIGDSMHAQVAAGLHCELQRRGYSVYRTTEKVPKKNQGNHNHDFLEHFYYNVTSPTWDNSSSGSAVQISYHMLYQFPLFNNHSRVKMAEILSTSQVLVLGMGLHWKYGNIKHGRTRWPKDMGRVFQQALGGAKKSAVELLVERETTAQHFDVPGGDYHEWRTALSQQQQPTRQQQQQQQPGERPPACTNRLGAATYWRERLLDRNKTQQQYGYQRIMAGPNMTLLQNNSVVALPYHNFTQLFDKMHPTGGADCTHYCSSPFLYMTLWRSLRLAMDHRYKKKVAVTNGIALG